MNKRVKVIAAVLLLLAVGATSLAVYLSPARFESITCRADTVTLSFIEQGTYDYTDEYEVLSLISGEVIDINVKEGDSINKGDVIATIDASEYEHQVNQMKAQIEGYEGNIVDLDAQQRQRRDSLQSELEALNGQLGKLEAEARASSDSNNDLNTQIEIQRQIVETNERMEQDAYNELTRVETTGNADMIATAKTAHSTATNATNASRLALQQLEAGIAGNDVYETQRQSLQSQISRLQAQMNADYTDGMKKYYESQIQSTQASIDQLRDKAEKAEIVCNVSGIITSLPIKSQNTVSQQSKAAVIASNPHVEAYVPIREIDGVNVGDKAELLLDKRMGSETVYATVTEIADSAEVRQSALGVEERKVRVLLLPDSDGLRIGYDMDVRFSVYSQENAIVVPKTAVFSSEGKDYVWLIVDGKLRRQAVTKGIETNDGYIIDDGLQPNNTVVRNADDTDLQDGKRAEPAM